jgi:hypothetical protein
MGLLPEFLMMKIHALFEVLPFFFSESNLRISFHPQMVNLHYLCLLPAAKPLIPGMPGEACDRAGCSSTLSPPAGVETNCLIFEINRRFCCGAVHLGKFTKIN